MCLTLENPLATTLTYMFADHKDPIKSYRQLDYLWGVVVSNRMNYFLWSFQELVFLRKDQNTITVKVCELLRSYT